MSDDIVARLGFSIEDRDGDDVVQYANSCFRLATGTELAMWSEITALRAELSEQARINGMGAERELKLIAERDEARGEVAAIVAFIRECELPQNIIQPSVVRDFLCSTATAIEARAYVKGNGDG